MKWINTVKMIEANFLKIGIRIWGEWNSWCFYRLSIWSKYNSQYMYIACSYVSLSLVYVFFSFQIIVQIKTWMNNYPLASIALTDK